jgi:hypothetical protein
VLLTSALLLLAAPAPSIPSPITDAQLYKDAMECKVLVETLQTMAKRPDQLKSIRKALVFWTDQERKTAAKLGKAASEIMTDEIVFGYGIRGDSIARLNPCMTAAATAR